MHWETFERFIPHNLKARGKQKKVPWDYVKVSKLDLMVGGWGSDSWGHFLSIQPFFFINLLKWRKENWGDALLIFTVNSPKFWEILTSRTVDSPFLNFGYVNFNCPALSEFRLFTSLCRLKLKCTAARICLQGKTLQCYNLPWVGVWWGKMSYTETNNSLDNV